MTLALILSHFFLAFEAQWRDSAIPIPWAGCCEQLPSGLKQVRQRCQDLALAAVLGQATQPGLLKAELLLDHAEGMLELGADVGFGCLDQILQPSIWCIR